MDQVAQIREKIDIVQLLSEYITVKKAGRNFKANCPFHNEKSPSFMISPERGMWHCFGCQKGGDAYSFLMEYEHMDFPEALRFLAKRAGVELDQSPQQTQNYSKKEQIYKLNSLAAEYYHYLLTKHKAGAQALAYITNRVVNPKVIESFKIGYAPHTRNSLSQYLIKKKQFMAEDLIEAGLAYFRGRDITDFFWGRIIFPLYDHRDNVVGFSGRILTDTATGPKYINTRETLVYHKGDLFFGLNMTKDAIRKQNQAIIVEGEFDVLSCFQHGVGNVVAVKGTALTENQVNLLARFAQKITICFDGDSAGKEAIKRSLPIIEKKGLTTTVIVIPNGKDPDESLKDNEGLFKKAVKEDITIYDYLLDQAVKSVDIESPDGKKQVADEMLKVISLIQNEIIKEHYLRKLSQVLETTYESITKELQRLQSKIIAPREKAVEEEMKKSREEIIEEYLIALILQSPDPKHAFDNVAAILTEFLSKERAYQKIIYHLLEYFQEYEKFDSNHFGQIIPAELLSVYSSSLLFPLPTFDDDTLLTKEIEKAAQQLKSVYIKERMKSLTIEIKTKEKNNDEEGLDELNNEFSRLATLLQK
ncbi:DNA primase [soil metagenome]